MCLDVFSSLWFFRWQQITYWLWLTVISSTICHQHCQHVYCLQSNNHPHMEQHYVPDIDISLKALLIISWCSRNSVMDHWMFPPWVKQTIWNKHPSMPMFPQLILCSHASNVDWCLVFYGMLRIQTRVFGLVHIVFAGPVRWTEKKTEIGLNPTAKDRTTGCGCTNSEFFWLPVAMFVEKSKNWEKPV